MLWYLESICLVEATCWIQRRPITMERWALQRRKFNLLLDAINTLYYSILFYSFIDALSLNRLKIWWKIPFTAAQELFSLFFAI